jgi:hypothetical protein
MSLEGRIDTLEDFWGRDEGPTWSEILCEAEEEARERRRLGLPRPLPEGEYDDDDHSLAARYWRACRHRPPVLDRPAVR